MADRLITFFWVACFFRDERPIANQTELIYSVFVNGRPVLAVTAANDMKLVSESEVATVMGKEIFMKAERKFIS